MNVGDGLTPATDGTPARVLLLEDSDLDAELVQVYLQRAKLPLALTRTARRSEFMAALASAPFDLVLADYSLPDFDGMSALRLAREHLPDVPFIFVSGVVGEDIATDALRQGATDYVVKRNLGRLPNAVERALAEARERTQRRHAEDALGASEANTRLALEAAALGLWQYTAASDSFSLDPRCQAMCGIAGQPLFARADLVARCHPQERAEVEARLAALVEHGAAGTRLLIEFRLTDPPAAERWLVMRGEAMADGEGDNRPARVLGLLQDVTVQRLAAARQRRTELMFRLAAEAADIGVWELDPATGSLWFDDGLRMLADLPADATLDASGLLRRVVHPDDRLRFEAAVSQAADLERSPEIDVETRMVGLVNQQLRWVAVKGRRIVDGDGALRLVGTARDVTAEHREGEAMAERVTLRTRERDRVWNLSVDLMDVRRPDGTLTSVNPAWERLLGWNLADLLNVDVLSLTHPDDIATTTAAMNALRRGQNTVRFDNRCRRRDGGWRWIRWTASGEAGLFYAIGRDVTDEKAAADELAATNRELKAQIEERSRVEATLQQMQRLEAVGQLTAGVAHDFNNLLTVVLSNIGLVRRLLQMSEAEADPRVLQRLDSMKSAAERGASLTAQLLAFSRRQRLEPQAVDLNEIALGMRDLLQTTMGGSVKLSTDLADTLWPALVDATQLELIILNLAINARDAMEVGGSLTLRTANVTLADRPARPEHPEPGDYAVLTVVDSGSGMPDEVLAKAFEPFFTTKAVGRGSGLGLPQVYGFAKQSGGGVRIDTEVGRGTAVHVYMPRAARVSPAAAQKLAPADTVLEHAASGQTLLLVDDDAAVREVTAAVLQSFGYAVVQADNGPAALARARDRRDLDLVVADFAMPGMNGAEMGRAMALVRPDLQVLFITGFVDLAALSHVPEDHVLQKPFREDQLAERLRRLLSRAPALSTDPTP